MAETIKSLFYREYDIKRAVENITFSLERGELVGFVGQNGAGKSTTIKMLTGILHPTSGEVKVRGIIPHMERRENAMHIGVVFGQRSQLYWDLPMSDTFNLYKKIYKIDNEIFKKNVDFYTDVLDMGEFLDRPVRQLSLGQKMRAEIAVAFIHNPDIVFLDEPTIGLDALAKRNIREFIKEINKEKKITVILTTHDMNDIEEICNRLILIDKGKLLYDGGIAAFKQKFADKSTLEILPLNPINYKLLGLPKISVTCGENENVYIHFNKNDYSSAIIIKKIIEQTEILDFSIIENDIDDILSKMYKNNM